jgi:hypothetical protein
MRRLRLFVVGGLLGLALWLAPAPARADDYWMGKYFYYPYYFFPHNYWPQMSPPWPEPPGSHHYVRPPAYMAYPPFREPHWRYEMWEPQSYYRGFHFLLDIF